MKPDILPTNKLLASTREHFEKRRQSWTFHWRPYNRLARPYWARRGDTPFECIYQDYKLLLKGGTVVWSVIVQANILLHEPGNDDCPASVVFSLGKYVRDELPILGKIAGMLFSLKGHDVRGHNPEWAEFADAITNEEEVLFNRELPESITYGRDVYYTTIMVHRKHLPIGFLNSEWLPLLVAPDETPASMILPSRYWASWLVDLWTR